ncbi:hypothetical protein ACL02R_06130 [Streptomyces sp. MS19]|uniref:hypothetical protein n=1 Tax=Streptomyces sp. MS19 TaxID=3385972 RepID=UPI0039A28BEC
MRVVRGVLAVAGTALLLAGVRLVLVATPAGTPAEVAMWLGGAVVAHDVVLASCVMLAGVPIRRLAWHGAVRGGLLAGGCATLVVLPILLRPGAPRNPTVLPLDYPANLAALWAAVALATAAVALSGRRRTRRTARPAAGRGISSRPGAGR